MPALLLVGVVLLAYWNACFGAFQFDDYNVIVHNPGVASLEAWWRDLPGIRPLLKLSYALNRAWLPESGLGEAGRFGFHAVNLALHAGNVLLLHALFRRLWRQEVDGTRLAWLAAALFAAHPVHSEAVTLISGRSMALMALFYLAAVLAHLEGRRFLSLAAFAAALASRETALTLPAALLLMDRLQRPQAPWRDALRAIAAHLGLALLGVLALLLLPHFRHLAQVSLETRPLLDNLITQSGAVLYLLGQWCWPLRLDADPVLPVFTGWNLRWLLNIAALTGLAGLAILAWRRGGTARWVGFGLIWCLLHLAPSNSLLPRLDIANERHLYLAGAGLALPLALALRRIPWAAVLLVLGLAFLTQERNQVYQTEIRFWQDVADKNPGNARAWNNLGYALAQADRLREALMAYDRALALNPRDYKPILNRAALCRERASLPGCPPLTPAPPPRSPGLP